METNAGIELEKNNLHWKMKLNEVKNIMTMQLNQVADSLCKFNYNYENSLLLTSSIERRIRLSLKRNDIYVRDIYYYKNDMGIDQMGLYVRSIKSKHVKTSLVANVISQILGEKMELHVGSRESIGNSLCEILLVKKKIYEIATSFKGMKKEGEILCGDNYSIIDNCCGQSVMILSDGMGTGRAAFEESRKLIEMVEEFLTVGFAKDIAIKLVNSAMYINSFESNMYATADICIFDNYTGECEFLKYGASPTFIKREEEVIVIQADSLPIGVFNSAEYESKKIKLFKGDVIVMITDGLEECMPNYLDSIEEISNILKGIKSNNPRTISNELITTCLEDRVSKDDISVLVGIIWENN